MSKALVEKEPLYLDVPPTQLRNRNEKFRKAKWVPFWVAVADYVFARMIEHRFFALRYKNKINYDNFVNPDYPCIFYAPHCNWWDGIVCYNLSKRVFRKRVTMMIEEMNRFPLFNYAGAFPVNKKSAQAAMAALKHSVELLVDDKTRKTALWIFPQGIIRPPHYRPIEFQTGIAYIAQNVVKKVGGVNLVPLSYEYCFLREHRPEVLVDIGKPIVLTDVKFDRHELTLMMETSFEELCVSHFNAISQGEVSDYEIMFKQKLPWYREIEKYLKSRGFKFKQNSSSMLR